MGGSWAWVAVNGSLLPPTDNTSPVVISLLKDDMRAVSAGGVHSLALSANFIPYSWGDDEFGALGQKIPESTNENECPEGQPAPVTGFLATSPNQSGRTCEDGRIIQIAAGLCHSLFLSINGNVYQCGSYTCDEKKVKFRVVDKEVVDSDTTTEKSVFGINETPVHMYQMPNKAIFCWW